MFIVKKNTTEILLRNRQHRRRRTIIYRGLRTSKRQLSYCPQCFSRYRYYYDQLANGFFFFFFLSTHCNAIPILLSYRRYYCDIIYNVANEVILCLRNSNAVRTNHKSRKSFVFIRHNDNIHTRGVRKWKKRDVRRAVQRLKRTCSAGVESMKTSWTFYRFSGLPWWIIIIEFSNFSTK